MLIGWPDDIFKSVSPITMLSAGEAFSKRAMMSSLVNFLSVAIESMACWIALLYSALLISPSFVIAFTFLAAAGAALCFTYTVSALALTTFNSTDSPMLLILRITEKTHKCLFNDLTTTPISSQADFPFNTLKQVSPDFQGN